MGAGVKPSDSQAGDILFYNKSTDKLLIVNGKEWSIEQYPIDSYTPVGVVAVPGYHDVYGDGSCGVVSLVNMSTKTKNGTTGQSFIEFGQYGVSTPQLNNFDCINLIANQAFPPSTDATVVEIKIGGAFMPSDSFSVMQCTHDKNAYYDSQTKSDYSPSPYLTNGERNESYYHSDLEWNERNCLQDFNGLENTNVWCSIATKDNDWLNSDNIKDSGEDGYSPAACCCWRYHTEGTNQKEWYLPSSGEMGYVLARLKLINDTIDNIISTNYTNIESVHIDNTSYSDYWCSTNYNNMYARFIRFESGFMNNAIKKNNNNFQRVRAFLRINENGVVTA